MPPISRIVRWRTVLRMPTKIHPQDKTPQQPVVLSLDWTYYDLEANSEIDALIAKYLRRDYSTPIEGYADARFALLKCIDMYHSHRTR